MQATDRFSLASELRSRENIPVSITEKKASLFNVSFVFASLLGKIKTAELIILARNLSGMLKAGLSLSRALSVLRKQTKNVALDKVIASISSDINAGATLSSGLAKFPKVFSRLFVSMVKAGEESGNLASTLAEVGENLEKAHSLSRKIKGALIYPGIILSVMVVIGILMFAFVVPTLASTFRELGVVLPVSTRIIIVLGNFFSHNLILTFLIIAGGIFGLLSLFRAKFMSRYIDFAVIRLPLIGNLTKELNTARTTRTLSSLLSSGVSITRALEITEEVVQNFYYKKILEETKTAVEKGVAFSKIFKENSNFYPTMMSEMTAVGEETGKLSDMLMQVTLFYEEEIENKTRNLSVIIEPILMVLIGAGVGFFAISMISPLYSILSEIK